MTDDDAPVERPTLEGDVYIYTDEDISRIAGEAYAQLIQLKGMNAETAEQAAELFYELATGDWTSNQNDT